jgi:hypothetical protein
MLADGAIRAGQQACGADALVAEQVPALTVASLLARTTSDRRRARGRQTAASPRGSDSRSRGRHVNRGSPPCLRTTFPCLPEIDGRANAARLLQSPRRSSAFALGGMAAPWAKQPPHPHCCSRRLGAVPQPSTRASVRATALTKGDAALAIASSPLRSRALVRGRERMRSCRRGASSGERAQPSRPEPCHGPEQDSRGVPSSASRAGQAALLDHAGSRSQLVGSLVAALVAEQKSAELSGALLRFVYRDTDAEPAPGFRSQRMSSTLCADAGGAVEVAQKR